MHDVEQESGSESAYECLDCGEVVAAESYPGECPSCGASLRNRGMPLE
jgi:rubrerythrin